MHTYSVAKVNYRGAAAPKKNVEGWFEEGEER